MRESAPGEDGVRIGYIREACDEVKEQTNGTGQRK